MNFIQKIFKSIREAFIRFKKFLLYSFISIVVLIFLYVGAYFLSYKTVEVSITDKERITYGSDQEIKSKYMVFTTDEVFQNTDNYVFGKFDSSDVQNKLMVGNSYQVKVVGWRVPLFSWYRNIISVE